LFSMGNYMGDERSESLVLIDHARRLYRKLVLYDNRVVGVLMYGNTTDSVWYQQLIKNRVDISKFREQLIFGRVEQEQAEAA
jgi:nitrite reductase [NAD(P)H] large subunit